MLFRSVTKISFLQREEYTYEYDQVKLLAELVDAYNKPPIQLPKNEHTSWSAPSLYLDQTLEGEERRLVIYGEELIANTSKYLGPNGSVAHITNGMNCQNCHLDAGTRPYGNNFSAVASTYPKFRARSGTLETIEHRINDCIQRSLNGKIGRAHV